MESDPRSSGSPARSSTGDLGEDKRKGFVVG